MTTNSKQKNAEKNLETGTWSDFIHQYSLQKTLRFALIPQGKTGEHIKKKKLIDSHWTSEGKNIATGEDAERAKNYKIAKKLFRKMDQLFIDEALQKKPSKNFLEILDNYYELYISGELQEQDDSKDKKTEEGEQDKEEKKSPAGNLATHLKTFFDATTDDWKKQYNNYAKGKNDKKIKLVKSSGLSALFSNKDALSLLLWKIENGDIAESFLQETFGKNKEQILELLHTFDSFATYFKGFHENRANVYHTKDIKKTSIAHRLFVENIDFFIENMERWEKIQKSLTPQRKKDLKKIGWDFATKIKEAEKELGFKVNEMFTIKNYVQFFSQGGIDSYNLALGGKPATAGEKKVQGLNEIVNLTRQNLTRQKFRADKKDFPVFHELYKQILSENDKQFIEVFESGEDLFAALQKYQKQILQVKNRNSTGDEETQNEKSDLPKQIEKDFSLLYEDLKTNNMKNGFFLSEESLQNLSIEVLGGWNTLQNLWYEHVDVLKQENGKPLTKKESELLKKQKVLSFAQVEMLIQEAIDRDTENLKTKWQELLGITEENSSNKNAAENFMEKFIRQSLEQVLQEKDQSENETKEKKNKNSFALQEVLFPPKEEKELVRLQEILAIQDTKELQEVAAKDHKKAIKFYLDSAQGLYHFLKFFTVKPKDLNSEQKEQAADSDFQGRLKYLMDELNPLELYNKTRNYLTKKDYSVEKIKLNFENSTLADGWDKNKESDNISILFKKNGLFYLGVMNKEYNDSFEHTQANEIQKEIERKNKKIKKGKTEEVQNLKEDIELLHLLLASSSKESYEKMNYKFFPDATKMIPKCSTQLKQVKKHFQNSTKTYNVASKSFIKPIEISQTIYNLNNKVYGKEKKKKFQKGYLASSNDEKGYRTALTDWINFCKDFLNKYSSTAKYNFSSLKEAQEYESLDKFYQEVNQLCYQISFENIPATYIDALVEKGRLYFFQIYSKDFSAYSSGKKNLHTLYWENLFAKENLNDAVIKLNGQAELFYRQASIKPKDVFVHKENTILKHKRYAKEWENLDLELSNKTHYREDLKQLEKDGKIKVDNKNQIFYQEKIIGRIVGEKKEIVKDKRFTQEKYLFHCPITLNFKESDPYYFNDKINRRLAQQKPKHLIGIDRGEKHLLYIILLNEDGKIIEQRSLNKIDEGYAQDNTQNNAKNNNKDKEEYLTNYHAKLDRAEKDRDKARKSWDTIENIKELKAGYLSQVVYLLSKMIIDNNAIVVLENLNMGFKRGRFAVEKQVYQKFERALIEKLNYLVFKDKKEHEAGHPLKAFQLTKKFQSFEKLGTQSGILFYTAAGYTSKTDPLSGYMQTLYHKFDPKNTRDFFASFDSIEFDGKHFYFTYDLKKTVREPKEGFPHKTQWTVCSCVERSYYNTKNKTHSEPKVVSEDLKELFKKFDIELKKDIQTIIADENTDEKFVKSFLKYFNAILNMRVVNPKEEKGSSENDFIFSPVKPYFDSRKIAQFDGEQENKKLLPANGDANGAYNIARKGIIVQKKNYFREQIKILLRAERLSESKLEENTFKKIKNQETLQTLFQEWLLWMEISTTGDKDISQKKKSKVELTELGKEFFDFMKTLSVSKKDWQNFCQRKKVIKEQEKIYEKYNKS